MGVFYGSHKSTPATQLTLFIDKVYDNRAAMEEATASDQIFVGRYVLIAYNNQTQNKSLEEVYSLIEENAIKEAISQFATNYEEINSSDLPADEKAARIKDLVLDASARYSSLSNDFISTMKELSTLNDMAQETWSTSAETVEYNLAANYTREENAKIDVTKYGERFDHTVWMKQYTATGERYVQIGSLDARLAKLTLIADLPASTIDPQIDVNNNTWDVILHMPKNWTFDTDPSHLDIGAELFDPNWHDLNEYEGTPFLGFITNNETSTKTLEGNLRILGSLVEQAHEIIYGHTEEEGRNKTWYEPGGSGDYNKDPDSLLGLLNAFRSGADTDVNVNAATTLASFKIFITKLAKLENDAEIKDRIGDIGEGLHYIINDIIEQVVGVPTSEYSDFTELRLKKQAQDNGLIKLLNNKHYNELKEVKDLLAYLDQNDTEPILNLYTLTVLAKYLLTTMSAALTSIAKPNHLKAFKFNTPIGGSLKNVSEEVQLNWPLMLNFHVYLENNSMDDWFQYARGGLLITADVDGSTRCLAYLPRKTTDDENDINYFVDQYGRQRTHFNVDLSENPPEQEGWFTWRNHGEDVINTGVAEFDGMSWVTESIVKTFSTNTVFTAYIFYNITGITLYESKKLKLLEAPYYLYYYGNIENDFTVINAEEKRHELETDWENLKARRGWNEVLSVGNIEYEAAYASFKKEYNQIRGDIYTPNENILSQILPMNTGELRREYGSVANITHEQNVASRATNKYVYIFSRFPVGVKTIAWAKEIIWPNNDITVSDIDEDNVEYYTDEQGEKLLQEPVLEFKLIPEGEDMGASKFYGDFEEKIVVYTDKQSRFTYNYLYIGKELDPIDVTTKSSLEMIIRPEPAPEDEEDPTLSLTPFVGAEDTNAANGIIGVDGVQGIVPQPLEGDQYAYLMGNGEWSHLRADAGIKITPILNQSNKQEELTIEHTNYYDGSLEINSSVKISPTYASAEERASASTTASSSSSDSSDNASVYHRHKFYTTTTIEKTLENGNVVKKSPVSETHEVEFIISNNADFTNPMNDQTITEDQRNAQSYKNTAQEVIDWFDANCNPSDQIKYQLIKTIHTERVWDNDLLNDFPAQEQITTTYKIVAVNTVTGEEIVIAAINPDNIITSQMIDTARFGFGSVLSVPCFTLDMQGHITSTWNKEFKFLDTDQLTTQIDDTSARLIYTYDSGVTTTLFEVPVFKGTLNEGEVGKVGLVPAPGKDFTKSIAYQNQYAALMYQYIPLEDLLKYIEAKIIYEYIQDPSHTDPTENEIKNLISTELNKSDVVSHYENQSPLMAGNTVVYPAHTLSACIFNPINLQELLKLQYAKSGLVYSLSLDSFSTLRNKIENDLNKSANDNQSFANLLSGLYNQSIATIGNLNTSYNGCYHFLQGNGAWGPVSYDYEIELKADGWKAENGTKMVNKVFLPGLKSSFATFAEINVSELETQEELNKILQQWSWIDRIHTNTDEYLIAECFATDECPNVTIPIILKVVIR